MLKVMQLPQTQRSHPHIPHALLVLSGIVVLLILSTLAWFSASWGSMPSAVSINNANPTQQPVDMDAYYEQIGRTSSNYAVTVKSWNVLGAKVQVATTEARVYPLVSPASEASLRTLVSRIGDAEIVPGSISEDANSITAQLKIGESKAMVVVEKTSGRYDLQLLEQGSISIAQNTADELVNVQQYAQQLMGADVTIEVAASYARRDAPNVRYYEAHRSWIAMGMPVVNAQELFAQTNITSLPNIAFKLTPDEVFQLVDDANIIKTSDERSAKVRSDRANTITLGVRSGKVVSIVSHMRQFASEAPRVSSLLDGEEALTRLAREGFEYMYIDAQNTNHQDSEKIYPNERVLMNTARVTHGRMAYLEEVEVAQKELAPYYVFVGEGTLENGQAIDFLAAVPAVQKINSGALLKPKVAVMSRKIRQIIEQVSVNAHAQD